MTVKMLYKHYAVYAETDWKLGEVLGRNYAPKNELLKSLKKQI